MPAYRYDHGHFQIGRARVPYVVRRSVKRRRSIGLIIRDEEIIRIQAPLRTSFASIERLVRRHEEWINRRIADLRVKREHTEKRSYAEGEAVLFGGKSYALHLTTDKNRPQGCALGEDYLEINLHEPAASEEARREEARLEFTLWCKKEARRIFKERADHWAEQLGVSYRRLVVSNPLRHWGSCTARDDIRINWKLVLTAPALLDYVVVHELCHVAHKNHSPRFWCMVEAALPDAKARRKELHRLEPMLVV